jgi:hypothetical protein
LIEAIAGPAAWATAALRATRGKWRPSRAGPARASALAEVHHLRRSLLSPPPSSQPQGGKDDSAQARPLSTPEFMPNTRTKKIWNFFEQKNSDSFRTNNKNKKKRAAGPWSSTCPSLTHDRIGSSCHVQQNGLLSHPQDLDAPLQLAAQRNINSYRHQYADNQNISFLPAIMTTSSRLKGEFLRLLFLLAHRETAAHLNATGRPAS